MQRPARYRIWLTLTEKIGTGGVGSLTQYLFFLMDTLGCDRKPQIVRIHTRGHWTVRLIECLRQF